MGLLKKGVSSHKTFPQRNIFQQALALHQAGRLQQAETLYRQILAKHPAHPQALHYLGLLAFQAGKYDIAAGLIRKAIIHSPDYTDAHINLGITIKSQGKLQEAVACFSHALTLDPDNPLAHYNLGNTFKELGRTNDAVASYQRALSLNPNYAEPLYTLGNIFNEQGKPAEAIACYRKVINLKPNYAEAYSNLGNILKEQDRPDEAVACFQQARNLKPNDALIHYNLGNTFKDLGKIDAAAGCFEQALALKPDFAEAYHALGLLHRELDRMDEAVACYRKALSLKPDFARAYRNLVLIVRYTEVDDDINAMADLYHYNENLSDFDRMDLGFSLGKVFEDLKDYDRAFAYILEANQLKRKSYQYSIREDQDLFARIRETFSAEFLASHHVTGCRDKTPIFVLGMPRSGTTLVEQILASHPLVFGAGELTFLEDLSTAICTGDITAQYPECLPDLSLDAFKKTGAEYITKIRQLTQKALYITDKMPHNFLHIGFIRTILPDAKVIHCLRNPMDTCYSIFKTEFAGAHKYAYDMVELGRYYKLYQDLMAHWEKMLPGFIYTLRYEELVADQENRTKDLLDFCGLPWDEACLAFHKTERRVVTASLAQVRQPIYKDSVELWKRYGKHLEPIRKAIYGKI